MNLINIFFITKFTSIVFNIRAKPPFFKILEANLRNLERKADRRRCGSEEVSDWVRLIKMQKEMVQAAKRLKQKKKKNISAKLEYERSPQLENNPKPNTHHR